METKLCVKEVSPADPNYVHQPLADPGIEPHPDFGNLRVRVVRPAPPKPEMSASEKAALAKLGAPQGALGGKE